MRKKLLATILILSLTAVCACSETGALLNTKENHYRNCIQNSESNNFSGCLQEVSGNYQAKEINKDTPQIKWSE